MLGEVVGRVQRRHERERALGRIALGLVVDVVEDQTVQIEREKAGDRRVGDLLRLLALGRETRRGEGEDEKLALAGLDATDQIQARQGIRKSGRAGESRLRAGRGRLVSCWALCSMAGRRGSTSKSDLLNEAVADPAPADDPVLGTGPEKLAPFHRRGGDTGQEFLDRYEQVPSTVAPATGPNDRQRDRLPALGLDEPQPRQPQHRLAWLGLPQHRSQARLEHRRPGGQRSSRQRCASTRSGQQRRGPGSHVTHPTNRSRRFGAVAFLVVCGVPTAAIGLWLLVVLLTPDDGRPDRIVGLLEIVLVAASLGLLWLFATRRKSSRLLLILPVVTALTVAHPFGIRAEPVSTPSNASASMVDPAKTHRIAIAGIPLASFEVSRRERIRFGGESGEPSHDLRIRSWVPPALLTSATSVTAMCGAVFNPCWTPEDHSGQIGDRRAVTLEKSDSQWFLRATAAAVPPDVPQTQSWRLSWGITSPLGALFWISLIVGVLWGLLPFCCPPVWVGRSRATPPAKQP